MREEIEEIPTAIARLLGNSGSVVKKAADAIRDIDPKLVCTVARVSSDHAATYLKYAIELSAKIPVASIGPSIASIYGVTLDADRSICIAMSQSGQSPDIVSSVEKLNIGGAMSVAITNESLSPLTRISDRTINILAGPERSTAATKTFVTSVVAGLSLLAHWRHDDSLKQALEKLPGQAGAAVMTDWSGEFAEAASNTDALFVLGRGPSLAIAGEAALKFKETCRQAEPFSSAEVLHGPVSIVSSDYPVLALIARDAAEQPAVEVADAIASRGANVFATSARAGMAQKLPFAESAHPLTDPLLLIVSFYSFVEKLARRKGFDPDAPRHLKKVTETL